MAFTARDRRDLNEIFKKVAQLVGYRFDGFETGVEVGDEVVAGLQGWIRGVNGLSGEGQLQDGDVTLSLAPSGVTAGAYAYPATVTVDGYGRISSITAGSGGASPTGAAGGDLLGSTYPNPVVAQVGGIAAATVAGQRAAHESDYDHNLLPTANVKTKLWGSQNPTAYLALDGTMGEPSGSNLYVTFDQVGFGAGAPASTPADGAAFFRTDGEVGTSIYVRQSGAWVAPLAELANAISGAPQALSGAGAINITTPHTNFTATGVGNALTLADGPAGKILDKTVSGVAGFGTNTGILVPTTKLGYSTITFAASGDSVSLRWTGAAWAVVGSKGVVIA